MGKHVYVGERCGKCLSHRQSAGSGDQNHSGNTPASLSVCKVKDYSGVDLTKPFCFTGTTDEENSLVCPEALVPGNTIERDDGWKGFRIIGQLDFSLIGILARISKILAEGGIGIFAISIYFICLYGAAGLHGSCRDPEQIKTFDWSGYHFDEDRSSTDEYVFIRTEIPGKPSRR